MQEAKKEDVEHAPYMMVEADNDRLNMVREHVQINKPSALFLFDWVQDTVDLAKAQMLTYSKPSNKSKKFVIFVEHQKKCGRDQLAVTRYGDLTYRIYNKHYNAEYERTRALARLLAWADLQKGAADRRMIELWNQLKEAPSSQVIHVTGVRRGALPLPMPIPLLPAPTHASAPLPSPAKKRSRAEDENKGPPPKQQRTMQGKAPRRGVAPPPPPPAPLAMSGKSLPRLREVHLAPSSDEDAVDQLASELPPPEQDNEWADVAVEPPPPSLPQPPARRTLATATRTIVPDHTERDVADILADFPKWLRSAREFRDIGGAAPPEGLAPALVRKLETLRETIAEEQQVRIRLAESEDAHARAVIDVRSLSLSLLIALTRVGSSNKTAVLRRSPRTDELLPIPTSSACMRTRILKHNGKRTNEVWPCSRSSCVSITTRLPSLSSFTRTAGLPRVYAMGVAFTVVLAHNRCPLTSVVKGARCTSSVACVASR
jgi:hypothetical protein